jgi:hypothetical protein
LVAAEDYEDGEQNEGDEAHETVHGYGEQGGDFALWSLLDDEEDAGGVAADETGGKGHKEEANEEYGGSGAPREMEALDTEQEVPAEAPKELDEAVTENAGDEPGKAGVADGLGDFMAPGVVVEDEGQGADGEQGLEE